MRIATFQNMMYKKLNYNQMKELKQICVHLCNFIEAKEELFKGIKGESIADSLLLIAGSYVGISKKDFLQNLRPNEKFTNSRITEIKKFLTYKHLKKGLSKIYAKGY